MNNACPKQARIDREAASLHNTLRDHPEVRAEVERAYRRGFHQAAYQAAEAARDRFTADSFAWWAKCLHRWRYARKGDDKTPPPAPWEVC